MNGVILRNMKPVDATTFRKRVMSPNLQGMGPTAARELLQIKFSKSDQIKVQRLVARSSDGTITEAERTTLEMYLQLGHLITLMQSKARIVLREKANHTRKTA